MNPPPLHFAQDYERYLVPILFDPWAQVLLQYANLQPGQKVLDVACGTGIVSRQAAAIVGTGGKVTGIDINPGMVSVAKSTPPPSGAAIEWREGNAMALQLPDHTYNAVLCQQAFQFFPDKVQALKEMRRVLVPGGRVVISINRSLAHNPVYRALNDAFVRHLGDAALAGPFSFGDDQSLDKLISAVGFQQVAVEIVDLPVRATAPAEFIKSTVLGSAIVVPSLQGLDSDSQNELIEQLMQEMQPVFAQHMQDGKFAFPVSALIGHGIA